jgi:hypothetical protein
MTPLVEPRRTKDGGYIVTVDDLRIGDRIRVSGVARPLWFPISEIEEKPKSRRVWVRAGQFSIQMEIGLLRRTTHVARAPREGEAS